MPDLTNFTATLTWIAAGGGASVAAWLLSMAAERIPAFQTLSADSKRIVMVVTSGLLGLAAWSIVTYVPADTLAQLAPAYGAFALSALAAASNQLAHAAGKLLGWRNQA